MRKVEELCFVAQLLEFQFYLSVDKNN